MPHLDQGGSPGRAWPQFHPWLLLGRCDSLLQGIQQNDVLTRRLQMGGFGSGWMNGRNEVYRDFFRLQFWVSTSKVRSNILAIGLIWRQKTFTEVLQKCAYGLPSTYKAFYWLGQIHFRKRTLMITWEITYKQVSLPQDFLLLDWIVLFKIGQLSSENILKIKVLCKSIDPTLIWEVKGE